MKKNGGFTLIEIIIVIGISLLLITAAAPSLTFLKQSTALDSTAQEIISVLRLAQNKTLAAENNSNFGVYFETDKFILFPGETYSDSSPNNEIHRLNSSVQISQIILSEGQNVVFERLSGATRNIGSITISATEDINKNKIIFIDSSGLVALSSSLPADDDRIQDSRHVHFTFNQNTKTSLVLSLVFPGLTQDIDYQDFLNTGETEFFWEGTTSVDGENQTLKIHSHYLTDTDTLFCIHRNQNQNTKALEILLDGQNLINYDTDGNITQGLSVWAGAPLVQ
jgi:prepilin-type N-terminal cleavage/methylation domain-containing protein